MKRILVSENLLRLFILAALIIIFGRLTGGVTYSAQGMLNTLLQCATTGMAAVGQTFVLLTGGIDISLYGIAVLASVVGAVTMTSRPDLNIVGGQPVPVPVGIALMIMVGGAIGALNGLLVSRLRVPALIATLGTWQIGYGLAQLVGGGFTITNLPAGLSVIGQGQLFGIPLPVVEMILLFAVAYVILHFTRFGRSVYAVGGNANSAYLAGIRVPSVQFAAFLIAGLTVTLAAISTEARMMTFSLRSMSGISVDSIAAAAVGGVSIYGGRGTIIGVLIGTLILAVTDNGLGTLGVSTEVLNTVKGAIIILAVSIDYFRGSRLLNRARA
jgi:ribose/xylose/arabinose/galactoside ABC-type transport system permease subunit